MKVKEIMNKKIISVLPSDTLGKVAQVLVRNKISGAPVINKVGKLCGVISEKDLFSAMYPNFIDIVGDISAWFDNEKREYKLKAKAEIIIESIMSNKVITTDPEESVLQAGGRMISNQIHRLIVVDKKKKVIGVISRTDIFRKILAHDLKIK